MIAAEGKIILLPVILLALTTTGVSIYTEMGGSGLKGVNIILWIFILPCYASKLHSQKRRKCTAG